jgi:predicted transcriptional regulator
LADPVRRRILEMLANGQALAVSQIAPTVGRRLDATLKHVMILRDAGFVTFAPDVSDSRRLLYALAPSVRVTDTPEGRTMDFGCCVVRM